MTIFGLLSAPRPAAAVPTRADLIGEITELTLDDPNDPFSGGTMVVGGERILLPRNILVDLPANLLSLPDLFAQAPPGCGSASGLARNDACVAGRQGAIATVLANRTNGGDVIAGEVKIAKGTEFLTGIVSFIDFQSGFFRINAPPGSTSGGLMVRLNDPSARHSLQSGPGCASGATVAPNCSPDVRFTGDPDNYTVGFSTGYPACLPSTVKSAQRPAPANAAGVGDAFCPTTNRTGPTAANSTRFAPLLVGDSVTITGNREVVNGVEFISAWSLLVNAAVLTLNTPTQPDYLKIEDVAWDAPGFNNNRARLVMIGDSTLSNAAVDMFSVHRDPVTNSRHQVPIGSTVNNNAVAGIGANAGFIFKVRYDVDFVQGAKAGLSPCGNLALAAGPGATPGFNTCAGLGFGAGLAAEFSVISPNARELVMRSRHHLALNAGVQSFDISGNVAPDGAYLTPVAPDYPNFFEIDLGRVASPFNFEGIPWLADRRLSPGGCPDTGCEATPQPLTPFPFSGLDPFGQVPVPAPGRILSFFPFGQAQQAPFPPVDPDPITLAPVSPAALTCSAPSLAAPSLATVTASSGVQGSSAVLTISGQNLAPGASCAFGAGIVAACNITSPTAATALVAIDPTATPGARSVVVTNPDNQSATLAAGFTVVGAPPPTQPSLVSVTPASAAQGGSGVIALAGSGFLPGATCSFGAGISAACNVLSATSATAVISVASGAAVGARDVVFTGPNNLSATLTGGFAVTAAPAPGSPAPTALLTASSNAVAPGGSSTLTFATTSATSVQIAPIGSFAVTSGTVAVSPSATTTYTLTATGPGGTATSSVTVAVSAVPAGSLFADSFNRSGALGAAWTVANGNFTLDGTLATASVTGRDEALAAGLSVADATVKVVLTVPATGTAGARLRRNIATGSAYAVSVAPNGVVLLQRSAGGVVAILTGANTGVAAGQSHTLTMKVSGASPVAIQVDLDGSPLITFNDAAPTRVTSPGTASIEGSAGSRWDDIQVF